MLKKQENRLTEINKSLSENNSILNPERKQDLENKRNELEEQISVLKEDLANIQKLQEKHLLKKKSERK